MIIIGVTGSIGMGKSTIASMLERLYIPVFDADKVIKDILENNNIVKNTLYELWPDVIINNKNERKVDKNSLSKKIFFNKNNRDVLEKILHPLVKERRDIFITNNNKSLIVALDVPLLYETGSDKICNDVFLAYTTEEKQIKRVLARPNMTKKKFKLIKKAQWNDEKKKNKKPYTITTSYGKLISFIIVIVYLLEIIFKRKILKL